jgi:hypothetical protein
MAELFPSPAEKEMAPARPTPIALAIALALAFPLHRRQIAIAVLVGMDKRVVIWVLRSMKALLGIPNSGANPPAATRSRS